MLVPITVFVNGAPSASRIVLVSPGSSIVLLRPVKLPDGSFRFEFAGTPGASYTAMATTNLLLPQSNWTPLGAVTEISTGQFQFTDLDAGNKSSRLYRVRSP